MFVKLFPKFPGLAFSENPNNTFISFGENISNVIAEAIVLEKKNTKRKLLLYLNKIGYNSQTLYLNPNSNFPYSFDIFLNNKKIKGKFIKTKEIKNNERVILFKIVLAILKNAIIFRNKDKDCCQWLCARNDKIPPNTLEYWLCSDNEKLEILTFLSQYLEILNDFEKDFITFEISKIAFESIDKKELKNENYENYEVIKNILYQPRNGISIKQDIKNISNNNLIKNEKNYLFSEVNTVLVKQDFLDISNSNIEKAKKAFDKISENIKLRGIASYIDDDEFIPTINDYGYAFLGLYIIENFKIN